MISTKVIKIDCEDPEKEKIKEAASVIKKGGVVAIPTDTVYGLAVDGLDKKAITRLAKIKNRPENKPFSLLVKGPKMLKDLSVKISPMAKKYMEKFWPGALTIILRNKSGQKLGLRLPRNKIAQDLILESGVPLVCPSANFLGEKPCVTAQEVKEKFAGIIELIVDGGKAKIGQESSVIDLTVNPPRVLREGAIPKKELIEL